MLEGGGGPAPAGQALDRASRNLDHIRGALLPQLATAIESRDFDGARDASGAVRVALASAESGLDDVDADGDPPSAGQPLAAARDKLQAITDEAEPILARAPAPRPTDLRTIDAYMGSAMMGLPLPPDIEAAEEAARTEWLARLDAPEGGASDSEVPDRAAMEGFFGESFADVQVQRGAAEEVGALGADAVTQGQSIQFAMDAPSPALVAHELAHVVQNRNAGSAEVMAAGLVGPEHSDAEAEAFSVGDRVATTGLVGPPPVIRAAPAAAIQRASTGRPGPQATTASPLDVMPRGLVFAPTPVGQISSPQQVAVTNPGASAVTIEDIVEIPSPPRGRTRVRIDGGVGESIAPAATTVVGISFAPPTAGHHDASVHVLSTGGVSSADLKVVGQGIPVVASHKPRLRAEPDEITASSALGEESEPVSIRLDNDEDFEVRIDDFLFADGRRSEFVVYGADGGVVPAHGSIELSVAFRPQPGRKDHRTDTLRVLAEGDIAAKVHLRGHESPTGHLAKAAQRGERPASPQTYAEMLDTVQAAAQLVGVGDYAAAELLAAAVAERLEEVASPERLDNLKSGRNGTAQMDIDVRIGAARTAILSLRRGGSTTPDELLNRFQYGREVLLVLTGEQKKSAELDGLAETTDTVLKAHLVIYATAVFLPGMLAMATPAGQALLSTRAVALFWQAGGPALQGIRTWVATHPAAAMALSEVAVGLGLNLGEGGIEGFLGQFESWEGFLFVLTQAFMDYAHVRGGAYADAEHAPRLPQSGLGIESTPEPPRPRASEVDGPTPPTPRPTPQPEDQIDPAIRSQLDEVAEKIAQLALRARAARDADLEASEAKQSPDAETGDAAQGKGTPPLVDDDVEAAATTKEQAETTAPKPTTPAREWVEQLKATLSPDELDQFNKMRRSLGSDEDIQKNFDSDPEAVRERLQKALAGRQGKAAAQETSRARAAQMKASIDARGLMEDPLIKAKVASLGPNPSDDEMANAIESIRTRLVSDILAEETAAKHPGAEVLTEVKILEETPAVSIEDYMVNYAKAEGKKSASGITVHATPAGNRAYIDRTDIDVLVIDRSPPGGGKARILHREEVKTGKGDQATGKYGASAQLKVATDLLSAAGRGEKTIRLELHGRDIANEINLASVDSAPAITRGTAGKTGFDASLGVTAEDLKALIEQVILEQRALLPPGGEK